MMPGFIPRFGQGYFFREAMNHGSVSRAESVAGCEAVTRELHGCETVGAGMSIVWVTSERLPGRSRWSGPSSSPLWRCESSLLDPGPSPFRDARSILDYRVGSRP